MELKLVFVLLLLTFTGSSQSCLNADGREVSWWVILKAANGKKFGYYDSTMKTGKFAYNPANVDEGDTALTHTLEEINNHQGLLEYVAWNDQPPTMSGGAGAHSKALIAFNSETKKGFLLDHSCPRYPRFNEDGTVNVQIQDGQTKFAQHLSCFSLTLSELEKIAYRIQVTKIFVFAQNLGDSASSEAPNIYQLATERDSRKISQPYESESFKAKAGFNLKSIFKNHYDQKHSLITFSIPQVLQASPYRVRTFTNSFPNELPVCTPDLSIYGVNAVGLSATVKWDTNKEHSKWILAGSQGNGYACFGDMNRQTSQIKRGGSFYCLDSPSLFKALQTAILSADVNCEWGTKAVASKSAGETSDDQEEN